MDSRKFINYPEVKRGPDVPYVSRQAESPAVNGYGVALAASALEKSSVLTRLIWKRAGFGCLRNIRHHLEDTEPCFNPLVIPLENCSRETARARLREPSRKKLPANYYSAADYHALYTSGELTPIAVAEAILPLIRRDISPAGPHSVAFISSRVDLILKAAKESTQRYKEKRPLGPLDGVPTGIKDKYDVDGYVTTQGSARDFTVKVAPGESITSWCVRQLDAAGAINMGKLTMHEFGMDTSGNNPTYGTPPNPYNPRYYTGGSSSGAAYALATGLIPIALGDDGGGSNRIPAAFCSIYGLKPSHGRVSLRPASNPSMTCATNGPMASDIASLAAMYQVLAAPDSNSHFPAPSPLISMPSSPKNKILGIPDAWFATATPAIQRLCSSAIEKLKSIHGYTIVRITIPFLIEGQAAHAMTCLNDATTMLSDTSKITAPNRLLHTLGRVTPATDYLLAQKLRNVLMQHLAYLWKQHPGMIIVTPTTSCAGWHIKSDGELKHGLTDGDRTKQTMNFAWMANFTGCPSISVPVGYVFPEDAAAAGAEAGLHDENKVPIGMMGMSQWGTEDELLGWGGDAEELVEEMRARAPIWVDVVAKAKEVMAEGRANGDGAHTLRQIQPSGHAIPDAS